ncbi:MAG: SPOR domain-containing protein [Candidatus Cloacimonetes bacterium]|nr:SPOR domain-containing protein [Candidatus Cloacimonadota bacterium]
MRKVIALIVIIIAIAALISIIAFIIGTVTHKAKATAEKQKIEIPQTTLDTAKTEQEYLPEYEEIFALQILASNKYAKVEHLQNKLAKAGYQTKITKLKREGEIIYRLRMEGLYQEEEAIALGEELKSKYPAIESFWLDEVETKTEFARKEESVLPIEEPATTRKEEEVTAIKLEEGKQFEIQLLASANYSKVEQIKVNLEKLGFNTKILTITSGTKIIYRLRMRGLYSEPEALALGDKLIKDSPDVKEFWLDEIKEGKSVTTTAPIVKKEKETKIDTGKKEYEIQILANRDRSTVEKRKRELEQKGYKAKITYTVKNGTTFYRLRLADQYSQTQAGKIGEDLKKNIGFVQSYWVVKKEKDQKVVTTREVDETLTEPIVSSMNPEYQPKTVNYVASCNTDNVNIRIGPGTYYAVDPIGKLMKGVRVFVVEEKNNWVRFTITPNDRSWSGWVKKDYLKIQK